MGLRQKTLIYCGEIARVAAFILAALLIVIVLMASRATSRRSATQPASSSSAEPAMDRTLFVVTFLSALGPDRRALLHFFDLRDDGSRPPAACRRDFRDAGHQCGGPQPGVLHGLLRDGRTVRFGGDFRTHRVVGAGRKLGACSTSSAPLTMVGNVSLNNKLARVKLTVPTPQALGSVTCPTGRRGTTWGRLTRSPRLPLSPWPSSARRADLTPTRGASRRRQAWSRRLQAR